MRFAKNPSIFIVLIFFILLTLCSPAIRRAIAANIEGTWTLTGDMNGGHMAATLLSNGKVLVFGGDMVEQFDPATNFWSIVNNEMFDAGTATLLNNGKVLAVGLGNFDTNTNELLNVGIYDPENKSWSLSSNLELPRRTWHTATRLQDGNVFVTGGLGSYLNGYGGVFSTTDLYHPDTKEWSHTASMGGQRAFHTATLLSDGNVLIVGICTTQAGLEAQCPEAELYNPNTNTWSTTGNMLNKRIGHTATLLSNGKVLVVGGASENQGIVETIASAELYDPQINKWTTTGNINVARSQHAATLLSDGKVLVAGGVKYEPDGSSSTLNSAEIYDPSKDAWTLIFPMNVGRVYSSSALLSDGKVLIISGLDGSDWLGGSNVLMSAEIYDPNSNNTGIFLLVPYFSQNTSPWGPSEYDHTQHFGITGMGGSMDRWGCAVTSVAMVLRYHNINEFADGTPVDPGSLNMWLKNNKGYLYGYGSDGWYSYLDWPAIGKLTKELYSKGKSSVKLEHKREYPSVGTTALLNHDLTIGNDISKFPDIFFVNNSSHFVVAKGIKNNIYAINDPEWDYKTLASFNNTYSQVDRYMPSHSDLSYLTAVINPDIEILVTDSYGRRTGSYVHGGAIDTFSEIPDATFGFEPPISNPNSDGILEQLGTGVNAFLLPKPTTDNFTITLSSNSYKKYSLNISTFTEEGDNNTNKFEGAIAPNIDNTFSFFYDKQSTESAIIKPDITLEKLKADLSELYGQDFIDNEGILNSLIKKVDSAIKSKDKKLSDKILNSFINDLNAQRGRHVKEEAYQILTNEAKLIIKSL